MTIKRHYRVVSGSQNPHADEWPCFVQVEDSLPQRQTQLIVWTGVWEPVAPDQWEDHAWNTSTFQRA